MGGATQFILKLDIRWSYAVKFMTLPFRNISLLPYGIYRLVVRLGPIYSGVDE